MTKYYILALGIITVAALSGCTGPQEEIHPGISNINKSLNKYTDNNRNFTLSIPNNWKVNVGDYISVEDTSDNGITRVRIQPIHLSGKYRNIAAKDIANYLIGKDKQKYQNFELNNVREWGNNKYIELVTSFKENGIDKKGVYTIFVNNMQTSHPYAMLSGYETSLDKFSEKEILLREISGSYQQMTPPAKTTDKEKSNSKSTSKIGELREKFLDGKVKMLLPDGWNTKVFPGCSGLVAFDSE